MIAPSNIVTAVKIANSMGGYIAIPKNRLKRVVPITRIAKILLNGFIKKYKPKFVTNHAVSKPKEKRSLKGRDVPKLVQDIISNSSCVKFA